MSVPRAHLQHQAAAGAQCHQHRRLAAAHSLDRSAAVRRARRPEARRRPPLDSHLCWRGASASTRRHVHVHVHVHLPRARRCCRHHHHRRATCRMLDLAAVLLAADAFLATDGRARDSDRLHCSLLLGTDAVDTVIEQADRLGIAAVRHRGAHLRRASVR